MSPSEVYAPTAPAVRSRSGNRAANQVDRYGPPRMTRRPQDPLAAVAPCPLPAALCRAKTMLVTHGIASLGQDDEVRTVDGTGVLGPKLSVGTATRWGPLEPSWGMVIPVWRRYSLGVLGAAAVLGKPRASGFVAGSYLLSVRQRRSR